MEGVLSAIYEGIVGQQTVKRIAHHYALDGFVVEVLYCETIDVIDDFDELFAHLDLIGNRIVAMRVCQMVLEG